MISRIAEFKSLIICLGLAPIMSRARGCWRVQTPQARVRGLSWIRNAIILNSIEPVIWRRFRHRQQLRFLAFGYARPDGAPTGRAFSGSRAWSSSVQCMNDLFLGLHASLNIFRVARRSSTFPVTGRIQPLGNRLASFD
jgi:hypothetical protein